MTGTFPYYSDGKEGETYGSGNYKATNGRLYKVTTSGTGTPLAWYPAPGYRHRATGALNSTGNDGYSWSSATNEIYCLDLGFGITWLDPCYVYGRAFGFQLRCLSE
ncbi:hypothetical protein [uncultured Rikenella sp.]|uniref:hypothetical protein n=1 Tax=uncultured Rikenella sp. TaxID=368003 RepID=UPI002630865C|nr:hypothetical protein [uncultured Rikenella sp.]